MKPSSKTKWDSKRFPGSTISSTTAPFTVLSPDKALLAAMAILFASMGLDAAIILKCSTNLSASTTRVDGDSLFLASGLYCHSVISDVVLVSQLGSGDNVTVFVGFTIAATSLPPPGVATRLFVIILSSSKVIIVTLSSKLE
jgi:uncharacterized membrane protein